jgi:hypothetical protein
MLSRDYIKKGDREVELAPPNSHKQLNGSSTMIMKLLVLILVAFIFVAPLMAQDALARSSWSIGTSLTFPMVKIYQLYVNYRIDDHHEVFFGPAFQNFRHESFTSNAYTLMLGYRLYLSNSVAIEAEVYPAYNRLYSHVTESYYPGWEMWAEVKVGYKYEFSRDRLYVYPAPGIGFGVFQSNPPPNYFEEIESPIFVPQVIMGVQW